MHDNMWQNAERQVQIDVVIHLPKYIHYGENKYLNTTNCQLLKSTFVIFVCCVNKNAIIQMI
jgi:hypothetical protein